MKHARNCFPGIPIYALIGGFHLTGANEAIIPQTVEGLMDFDLGVIAAGHCTGWRAVTSMVNAFGDTVVNPSVVGKLYTL